ncbi:MAG: UvrD-helicase domain-containing protein [Alkalispirochaeta sp.]
MTPTLHAAMAGLNTAQREAVLHQDSPLLILAGAGSGKTRVITVKIAWLIGEQGVDPRSILSVTFTNKAAGEMRERALALLNDPGTEAPRGHAPSSAAGATAPASAAGHPAGPGHPAADRSAAARPGSPHSGSSPAPATGHPASLGHPAGPEHTAPPVDPRDLTLRTFHSFGAWMLRRNSDIAGLPRGFNIYDDDDSITLLKALYPEQKRGPLARWYHLISRAKDYCLTPDDDLSDITEDPDFVTIYRTYQQRLEEIGNVDFGDLIMKPVQLLENEPVVAERMHRRFRYILVDEYQDSNVAQYRMLRALAAADTFVCVVGDDDQSIYRFRGAEVQNILSFPEIFPNTKVVRLEQNYRSTAPILDLAGAVVANNQGRLGKALFTERAEGALPRLLLLPDQDDEVSFVIDRVRAADRTGEGGETAVLYRTNAQSRAFETALLREDIPYRIVGAVRFWDREEVKDAVAFLKLLANPRDEVSFRRIVNKPARGLGAKSVERILDKLAPARGDLAAAADYAIPELSKKAGAALQAFVRLTRRLQDYVERGATADRPDPSEREGQDRLRSTEQPAASRNPAAASPDAAPPATLAALVEEMLAGSGLSRHHKEQDEVSGTQKVQNLEELVNAASLYPATRDGLTEFLEIIELDSAREQEENVDAKVVLITMHNTKGLEFDRVVITGLEEGLFPRDDDPEELEEERRLFYVAITRARNEVTLTSCRYRRLHGKLTDFLPSRFLTEIPKELVQVDADGYSGGFGHDGAGTLAGLRSGRARGENHPWPRGTAVYHDNYGAGLVTNAWYAGNEAVVLVRFETGATAQFIPKYTPLERIAGDDMEEVW